MHKGARAATGAEVRRRSRRARSPDGPLGLPNGRRALESSWGLYDTFATLIRQTESVDGNETSSALAERIRRIEREAGLPLKEMTATWAGVQDAVRAGRQARDELVEAHQWLVAALARKYAWSGLEQADLVAEGNLGLMHAVDKYDYRRGCRVSTYAAWWIRTRIERAITNTGLNIRLPVHLADRLRRYRKAADRLDRSPGSTRDPADIAITAGLRPEDVDDLLQLCSAANRAATIKPQPATISTASASLAPARGDPKVRALC